MTGGTERDRRGEEEAVLLQDLPAPRAEEGVAQEPGGGGLPRTLQDDAPLVHPRIALERDLDVPPGRAHLRREGEREGDDAGVGGAALDELRGLGDVLTEDELPLHVVEDAERLVIAASAARP